MSEHTQQSRANTESGPNSERQTPTGYVERSDVAESGNVTPSTVRTHYETLEERVA